MVGQYKINVIGPFDLLDQNGNTIRGLGQKNSALIALLALSPSHRQTRKWLQDKLWSDRGDEQGAASLRQALSKIRSTLGKSSDAFLVDRISVALNPEVFEFDHLTHNGPLPANTDLLQGINVRDEAFEDWLRLTRQSFERGSASDPFDTTGPPRQKSRLIFEQPHVAGADDRLLGYAHMLVDEIIDAGRTVGMREQIDRRVENLIGGPDSVSQALDMHVLVRVNLAGGSATASITATDWYGSIIWHVKDDIDLRSSADQRPRAHRLTQLFVWFLVEHESARMLADPDIECRAAYNATMLKGLATPGSVDVQLMSRCGSAAMELHPTGLSRALNAMIQVLRYGERLGDVDDDPISIIQEFQLAAQMSPNNGLVYALTGHAYSFFIKDVERGLRFTENAVKLAPNNGLCWKYHALSLAYAGLTDRARRAATYSLMINENTVVAPYTQSTLAFVMLLNGDLENSIRYAESSCDILPNFRPNALHLSTAYALKGNISKGRDALHALMSREPGFSLDALRSPTYPFVNLKHRSLVIDAATKLGLH